MKLLILMGLPASGKTTFAKQYLKANANNWYARKSKPTVQHLNMDLVKTDKAQYLKRNIRGYDEVIVDSLCLTNASIMDIIDAMQTNITSIEIHFWKPNVDACVWNDMYRRTQDSLTTIQNATLETPDIQMLKTKYETDDITVVMHEVQRKPNIQIFVDKHNIFVNDNYEMISESWCLGGSWGDCWGNSGTVSGEPQPIGFERFDDLLQEVCPDITFLQYKNLYNKCVSIDTSSERDYYGGSTSHAHFVCNIATLYSELVQLNLYSLS